MIKISADMSIRVLVLAYLYNASEDGLTSEDVIAKVEKKRGEANATTIRVYLSSLKKAGLLKSTQNEGDGSRGRPVHTWALTAKGRKVLVAEGFVSEPSGEKSEKKARKSKAEAPTETVTAEGGAS